MASRKEIIGATHDFHNPHYAIDWEARYRDHPNRQILFRDIGDLIQANLNKNATVLELGVGPGFLAHDLLNRFDNITYVGLDFSKAMLHVANKRLRSFADRFLAVQADLTGEFTTSLDTNSVVVTCWSLHDLGSAAAIRHVYSRCRNILDGILINADFIRPVGTEYEYESGRIASEDHLEMLRQLNYENVQVIKSYEVDVGKPTAANNYTCLFAEYRSKTE